MSNPTNTNNVAYTQQPATIGGVPNITQPIIGPIVPMNTVNLGTTQPNVAVSQQPYGAVSQQSHVAGSQQHQPHQPHQIPTNQAVTAQLDKVANTINAASTSANAPLLGPSGQRVMGDVQSLVQDHKNIVATKNEGDALQRVIRDAQALIQKLGMKAEGSDVNMFKSLANDWTQIFKSVTGGDDARDMAKTGKTLFRGLADTEEFFDLLIELINLAKLLVAQADAKITQDPSRAQGDFKQELEAKKEAILDNLNAVLNALAANDLWNHLVQQGRDLAKQSATQVKGAAGEAQAVAQQAAPQLRGNIWEILDSQEMNVFTEDLKVFLQGLIGNEHDVTPLFEYLKAALRDIKNDPELHRAIHEAEDTLHHVSANVDSAVMESNLDHNVNPAYVALVKNYSNNPNPPVSLQKQPGDQVQAQVEDAEKRVKSVAHHLEAALYNLRNNQNLRRAREEAHILREAFLNDPHNRQLITDAQQLWRDLQNPNGGGIDPTLLSGLRAAVVPILLDQLNNVPIPTIHGSVSMLGQMNYTIDNLRLSIPQILPDNLYVKFEYELDTTIRSLEVNAQRLYLNLELRNMHVHMRDVAWAYERLSAPHRKDSGLVDIDTLGDGITAKLKIQMHNDNSVEVKEAHVDIQKFSTTFRDSKHNKMYKGLSHVFAHQIKKNLTKTMETKIREMGAKVGTQLMQTVGTVRSHGTQFYGAAMGKKSQALELLRNKRAQHQPKEGENLGARVKSVREKSLFQDAVHKAAGTATSQLDEQQRALEQKKHQAHENSLANARMENAILMSHGVAPTLPNTNRPASPPVPAMTFIPDVGGNINTAPLTQPGQLNHVTTNPTIDSRPITDAANHSVDPVIQRALEQKLHLDQQQQTHPTQL